MIGCVIVYMMIGCVIVYMMIGCFCEQPNGASLKRSCRTALSDATISFPFIKEGPVYPMLKEVLKEALKQSDLSLVWREFEQTFSWLPLGYFRVIHSVRSFSS